MQAMEEKTKEPSAHRAHMKRSHSPNSADFTKQTSKEGAHVILTRTRDEYVLLSQRTLQSTKADAFISVHYNSTNSSQLTGLMTYYYHQHQDSPLTHSIHQSLIEHAKLKDKGERFGNYYVLRENTRPSTLIELGF